MDISYLARSDCEGKRGAYKVQSAVEDQRIRVGLVDTIGCGDHIGVPVCPAVSTQGKVEG